MRVGPRALNGSLRVSGACQRCEGPGLSGYGTCRGMTDRGWRAGACRMTGSSGCGSGTCGRVSCCLAIPRRYLGRTRFSGARAGWTPRRSRGICMAEPEGWFRARPMEIEGGQGHFGLSPEGCRNRCHGRAGPENCDASEIRAVRRGWDQGRGGPRAPLRGGRWGGAGGDVCRSDEEFPVRWHVVMKQVGSHGGPSGGREDAVCPCRGVGLAGRQESGEGGGVGLEETPRALVLRVARAVADQARLRCGHGKRGGRADDRRSDWYVELTRGAGLAERGCRRERAARPAGEGARRRDPARGCGVLATVPAHVIQEASSVGPEAGPRRVVE